jgi:hypothetical protein
MSTKNEHHNYVSGKLGEAVRRLVIGEGDVRRRLKWANEYVSMINVDMLPKEFHERWESIYKSLNRYPPSEGKSATEITLSRIKNSTGNEITNKKCELVSV